MKKSFFNGKIINENQTRVLISHASFDSYAAVENISVRKGRARYLAEHDARFKATRRVLGIRALPWDFADACRQVVRVNKMEHGNLQLRAWGDWASGKVEDFLVRAWARQTINSKVEPICMFTVSTRHYGPASLQGRLKAAAMLPNLLAAHEASAWAQDGLRLTPAGMVAEGAWTNIIIEKKGQILTPPLSEGILAGVTRDLFLKKSRKNGKKVKEVKLTRHDLYTADRMWICSSLNGPVPVAEVDGRKIGSD